MNIKIEDTKRLINLLTQKINGMIDYEYLISELSGLNIDVINLMPSLLSIYKEEEGIKETILRIKLERSKIHTKI